MNTLDLAQSAAFLPSALRPSMAPFLRVSQKEVHRHLRSLSSGAFVIDLITKLSRWASFLQVPLSLIAPAAIQSLSVASSAPSRVVPAVIRIWVNGLATSARFQESSPCPFCGLPSLDSVEHVLLCSSLSSAVHALFGTFASDASRTLACGFLYCLVLPTTQLSTVRSLLPASASLLSFPLCAPICPIYTP